MLQEKRARDELEVVRESEALRKLVIIEDQNTGKDSSIVRDNVMTYLVEADSREGI